MKQKQYHSISCAAAYSFSLYASTNKKSDGKQYGTMGSNIPFLCMPYVFFSAQQ